MYTEFLLREKQRQSLLTEMRGQKLYWEVFLGIANPGDTDFGRNPTIFQGERKGTKFIKTEKGGFQKNYVSCFEKAVFGAGKQTYTVLYT